MASNMSDNKTNQSESIHSGQFMVSHFEKDDDEEEIDDDTITDVVVSPRHDSDSGDGKELQRYNGALASYHIQHKTIVSSVEIDTDLSTIFNTLNVTYSQKLTSPKWNPFKGIRLRWKEKIRLNNVIWRCWHMQFILKRKTFVCQFASPLDTDVHKAPQAILLEGKYWKRKCNVIVNEYNRWRRYNVNKALPPCMDTCSEIEWELPPWLSGNVYDQLARLTDGLSNDTLFSAISQSSQFPFPDSREIARAGRADFIQPSLGPLQPNLEDLMDIDFDTFGFGSRLAPVPEEETSDILKAIDSMSSTYPMLEAGKMDMNGSNTDPDNTPMSIDLLTSSSNSQFCTQNQSNLTQDMSTEQLNPSNMDAFMSNQVSVVCVNQSNVNEENNMSVNSNANFIRNKIPRGYYRTHNRQPINYNVTEPTEHQTKIHNKLVAQQQNQPPSLIYPNSDEPQSFNAQNAQSTIHISPIQTTTNNFNIISQNQISGVDDASAINLSGQNIIDTQGMVTKIIQPTVQMLSQMNTQLQAALQQGQQQVQQSTLQSNAGQIVQNVTFKPQTIYALQQQLNQSKQHVLFIMYFLSTD